jgi:hypothetical protein
MAVISEHKARKGFGNLGIAALVGLATASHLRVIAVLVLVSLAAFLPRFFQIPPVDRDEARFAQATKQMIETGDYVDIRFQDETRYKKPVGIYWLQAAVAETVDGAEASLLRAAAGSIMLSVAAYAATFPAMRGLFPSVALANYVRGANCPDPAKVTAGFHEPSLVFLVGTNVNPGVGSSAADFLSGGVCRFAFVDSRRERAFVQRADAIGLRYAPGPRVEEFNISGGQAITIATYRSERAL